MGKSWNAQSVKCDALGTKGCKQEEGKENEKYEVFACGFDNAVSYEGSHFITSTQNKVWD